MRNIAIITARSGSKGLKNKNVKILKGKPLIAYSIEAALNSKIFDSVMVSTDSEEYAKISLQYGAEVPFFRSAKLSSDYADSWDVILEVLAYYYKVGEKFDTICLLQPTSPLRSDLDIQKGYKLLDETQGDCVISVCEMDHSPLWSNTLPINLSMKNFIDNELGDKPRQELPVYYRINGALYIKKIRYCDNIKLLDKDSYALIMEKNHSIDIDTDLDFKLAEVLMDD